MMTNQRTIISVHHADRSSEVMFWSGSGLSLDRAQAYGSREHAFCEWTEHSEAFPGYEAILVDVMVEGEVSK